MLDGLLFFIFSGTLVLTFTAVLILKGEVDLLGLGLSGNDGKQTGARKPSRSAQGKQQVVFRHYFSITTPLKLSLFSFFSL